MTGAVKHIIALRLWSPFDMTDWLTCTCSAAGSEGGGGGGGDGGGGAGVGGESQQSGSLQLGS